MRELRVLLITLSVICAVLLGLFTGIVYRNSLSAFDMPGSYGTELTFRIVYYLMHASAVLFFLLHFKQRRKWLDLTTGMLLGGVALFNMYDYYWIHVVVTVAALLSAIINQVVNAVPRERYVEIFSASCAVFFFCLAYFTNLHFLVGEVVAMACVGIGMVRSVN